MALFSWGRGSAARGGACSGPNILDILNQLFSSSSLLWLPPPACTEFEPTEPSPPSALPLPFFSSLSSVWSSSEASPDAKGCVDARSSEAVVARAAEEAAGAGKELSALVKSLADAQPSGALAGVCKTLDQVIPLSWAPLVGA